MVRPVRQTRGPSLESVLQQLAEGHRRHRVVTIATQEEQRRLQRPLHVGAIVEGPVQHPREVPASRRVHVAPHVAPVAHPPAGLSLDQRAVGEQRHQQRRQPRGRRHFPRAVGLRGPVQRDLPGAGHQHHVQGEPPAHRERLPHHLVALLRHQGDVRRGPPGAIAQRHGLEPELPGALGQHPCVRNILRVNRPRRPCRRPRQLELSAGLQRQGEVPPGERNRRGIRSVTERCVSPRFQEPQKRTDSPRALVRNGRGRIFQRVEELLVLQPYPVLRPRPLRRPEDLDQRVDGGDGLVFGRGAVERHSGPRL